MTIESQLERICVALERMAEMQAVLLLTTTGASLTPQQTADNIKEKVPGVEVVEVSHKPKAETKKVEPEAKAGKVDPEKPAEGSEVSNKTSFDDLADKVKALGRMNRDAVVTLFKQFGIERLGGLEEKDYIAFDIAIAKALNKANEA